MKPLANVLYVTTPEAYLSLDGENVVIKKDEQTSCTKRNQARAGRTDAAYPHVQGGAAE